MDRLTQSTRQHGTMYRSTRGSIGLFFVSLSLLFGVAISIPLLFLNYTMSIHSFMGFPWENGTGEFTSPMLTSTMNSLLNCCRPRLVWWHPQPTHT